MRHQRNCRRRPARSDCLLLPKLRHHFCRADLLQRYAPNHGPLAVYQRHARITAQLAGNRPAIHKRQLDGAKCPVRVPRNLLDRQHFRIARTGVLRIFGSCPRNQPRSVYLRHVWRVAVRMQRRVVRRYSPGRQMSLARWAVSSTTGAHRQEQARGYGQITIDFHGGNPSFGLLDVSGARLRCMPVPEGCLS